jgi:hypothetical protein
MTITHSFVSGIADGADATLVRPSNWNNAHTIEQAAAPTPTAAGDIAYATTQGCYVAGGHGGLTGSFPRVLSVTRPNEQKTNSTTADQDYTSIFTIPASYLIAQKVLRVSVVFTHTTDGGASTVDTYLKLGSTKVYDAAVVSTPANSVTRGMCAQFLIFGTAAAGASVAVDTARMDGTSFGNSGGNNSINQPVNLATNGTLTVLPGIAFSTNTGGESITLLDALVEELN